MLVVRSKLFWGGFTALACASLLFCYKYFALANPIVDLTISIDRHQAVEESKKLGQSYQWPLDDARTATVFGTEQQDALIQPFADLEVGGNDNYRAMINDGFYCPYKWIVRFFKEHRADEVIVRLTPNGKPHGFVHTMAEDKELPSLTEDAARTLAQHEASTTWQIDFQHYKEIEASHNTTPKNRIDYTFVYERSDATLLQDGKYRVRLKVCGNQVTEVTHLVKIPEAFSRKYELLSSKNNFLAGIASFLMYFLYIIGGCIIGGYFLFKRNMLFAKTAFLWALGIGLLQGLLSFNNLPLMWMQYKTAISVSSFLSSYCIMALFQVLFSITFCALAFSIATSLDNWAFPTHIRFWQSWSSRLGSSRSLLRQTVGGYLAAITFLGSATATYILFLKVFKWWSPASPLTDPNILATYVPWLPAIAVSLQAGFMEECLFRAVPLAGAVILGRYLKREKLVLIVGFIIQVFVFSAAHANYIQQPSYFRLLELMLPSTLFGLAYLLYGLVPGILCHFVYDVLAIGIPILISDSSSALLNKILLIAITLIPLFVVIFQRLRVGGWTTLTRIDYNEGEIPYIPEPNTDQPNQEFIIKKTLPTATIIMLGCMGTLSILALLFCAKPNYDGPLMQVSRTQAIDIATQHIPKDFIFAEDHSVLTIISGKITPEHIFVWQTTGQQAYTDLLGTYLTPPFWLVRFVSFTAPQEIRAEEYNVFVGPDGSLLRKSLIIPEHKTLPSLNKAEARGVALQAVQDNYQYTVHELEEISAQPIDQPTRTDWTFTFKHLPTTLQDGYAQINVSIAGNIVQDIKRSIFVPENWKREYDQKESIKANVGMIGGLAFVLLIIIAISSFGTGFLRTIKTKDVLLFGAALLVSSCLVIINGLPSITGYFSTARPFSTQLFTVLLSSLILTILRIIIVSLYSVHISALINRSRLTYPGIFFIGLIAGLIVRAAHVFGKWIAPVNAPVWGSYEYLGSYSILAMVIFSYLFMVLRNTTFGTITVGFLNNLQPNTRNGIFKFIFIFIAAYASIGTFETVASGIAIGLSIAVVILLLYHLLLVHDSTLWIPMLSGYFATYACGEFTAGIFPGYGTIMVVTGIALIGLNYYWFSLIRKKA